MPVEAGGGGAGPLEFATAYIRAAQWLIPKLFPGAGSAAHAQSITNAVAQTGVVQNVVARTQASSTYEAGGLIYPTPPPDYTGTVSDWQRMQRLLANTRPATTTPKKQPTPPPKQPTPPATTPPINPNAPGNFPATPYMPDPFGWIWLGQSLWANRDEVIRTAQARFHLVNKRKKKTKTTKLDPRLMRQSVAPKQELLDLTVPKIFQQRMATPRPATVPKTPAPAAAPYLSVPTITAQRLPTPTPIPTTPRPTLASKISSYIDPLTLSYLLNRPGAARISRTRGGTTIQYLTDPLTRPNTGALTSPLGAFAGVPATSDCTCTKKPGKKGRKKRRTICYEGSYRETATGTRKLRRQEVPCK